MKYQVVIFEIFNENGSSVIGSVCEILENSSLTDLLVAVHSEIPGIPNGNVIQIKSGIMNGRKFLVEKGGWSELIKLN